MNSIDRDDRFAPPQAPVADIAPVMEGGVQLASRKRRLAAAMIDGGIILLSFWVLSKFTAWNLFDPQGTDAWRTALRNGLIGFTLFVLVQGYLLGARGQTVGKALLGMRIVRPDGARASALRLLGGRFGVGGILGLVPVVGPIYGVVESLFIFRSSRRCLHDQIADTIVIKI